MLPSRELRIDATLENRIEDNKVWDISKVVKFNFKAPARGRKLRTGRITPRRVEDLLLESDGTPCWGADVVRDA